MIPSADDGIVVEGRITVSEHTRLTTDEYLAGEETLRPQELVWGVVRDAPTPHPRHQRAVFRLAELMAAHVRAGGLGEVFLSPLDVILDEARALVVQPDIFFVAKDRLHIVSDRVRGAPDLAVEILSPNTRRTDEITKRKLYERFGVAEYWVVDPELDTVKIYRRRGASFERVAELAAEAAEAAHAVGAEAGDDHRDEDEDENGAGDPLGGLAADDIEHRIAFRTACLHAP